MLRSLKDLGRYKIHAADGEVGGVKDLLFDDASWKVRYAVALAGSWLKGRRVLLSTEAFGQPDGKRRVFPVTVTMAEIAAAPGLDADPPVSRQHEIELHTHYRWMPYWPTTQPTGEARRGPHDQHLRSIRQVLGYRIRANDGEIGHLEDLIADADDWSIRYLVVDTTNHWPGGEVLISPDWCDGFDWTARTAVVNATAAKITESPRFRSSEPVNRAVEERLYDYYGRPRYWTKDTEDDKKETPVATT